MTPREISVSRNDWGCYDARTQLTPESVDIVCYATSFHNSAKVITAAKTLPIGWRRCQEPVQWATSHRMNCRTSPINAPGPLARRM